MLLQEDGREIIERAEWVAIATAVPVCYGATLLINLLLGYSINRVTLFALILSESQ
jgi:multidrug efflux pump subunit AcrB